MKRFQKPLELYLQIIYLHLKIVPNSIYTILDDISIVKIFSPSIPPLLNTKQRLLRTNPSQYTICTFSASTVRKPRRYTRVSCSPNAYRRVPHISILVRTILRYSTRSVADKCFSSGLMRGDLARVRVSRFRTGGRRFARNRAQNLLVGLPVQFIGTSVDERIDHGRGPGQHRGHHVKNRDLHLVVSDVDQHQRHEAQKETEEYRQHQSGDS